jgi:hypothetical protein
MRYSNFKPITMNRSTRLAITTLPLLVLLAACGGNTTEQTTAAESRTAPTAPPASENPQAPTYPGLPVAKMQELFQAVDYIDFVFYYTNFSMNQSNEQSIKATLGHVANEVPIIDPSCQPIGSIFFQAQGKELMQAELYFTEQCVYYIFLENGQRTYANKMTPVGFKFYQQIFSQAAGQAQ